MAYLGKTPSQAVRQRYIYTASGSETSISGADDNGNTLTFTDGGYVDVYLNGVLLVAGTDYNTTTANTIGGLTALSASDVVEIVVYDVFSVFGGDVQGDLTISNGTLTSGAVDINGGTIDGTTIGGTTPAAGTFTTLAASGDVAIDTDTLFIDSTNNRVGIGTTSPAGSLHISSSDPELFFTDTDTGVIHSLDGNSGVGNFYVHVDKGDTGSDPKFLLNVGGNTNAIYVEEAETRFSTNSTERMIIDSSGRVLVGYTTAALGSVSIQVGNPDIGSSSGAGGVVIGTNGNIQQATDTASGSYFNDSSSSAGTHNYFLWRFQGSNIGDIDTVDNNVVRYNTFTGAHWTQFEDGTQPDLPVGTVLSTIDDLLQWTEYEYESEEYTEPQKISIAGHDTIGSTKTIYIDEDGATAEGTALSHDTAKRIAKCKVSDVEGDKCVYGIFAGHYKDGDSSVESLGLGVIRIGSGVTVSRGDLLESAGDGTARPQTGDNADLFKAGTIAKVTSTTVVETYDDGSYTVPCTLHCG